MARNNRHNTAFVVGSVVGAVVGAAAALWKTPYSGEELRSKITGGGSEPEERGAVTVKPASEPVAQGSAGGRSIKDKVLSTVEKALAPVVGVELGKTANGQGAEAGAREIRVSTDVGQRGAPASTVNGSGAGLGHDRVDASEWAAAYGGTSSSATAETSATTTRTTPAASTGTTPQVETPRSEAGEGATLIGLRRDQIDAEKWAAAYGNVAGGETSATTGATSTASTQGAARESAEEERQGQDPAFRGDDGDLVRHPPADRGPSENVAPAAQDDPRSRNEPDEGPGAASIEDLTTPRVNRTPDAMQPTERTMHPFPKLGGKEG